MSVSVQLSNVLPTSFYDQNPNFDILTIDFHNPSELSQLKTQLKNAGIAQTDREETVNKLKAYQRLLRIEPDVNTAEILLDDGLDSAQKITALSQTQFIKEYGSKLGTDGDAKAKQIYVAAAHVKSQTMHLYANVASLAGSRHFRSMNVNHVSKSIPTYFESLSSYQQIFGSLDYCQCEECKSIFGAAAYLVDLLRIIDKAITVPNKDNIPEGLKLFDRRPDLAQIPLTCAKTNDLVPYLQIVNEILEQTVANTLENDSKLLNNNVWLTLANTYYPFNLPFNLPLQQIRTYLGKQQISLSEIYETLDPSGTFSLETSREYLHLSLEQLNNLKPTTDKNQLSAEVSKNYGLDLTESDLKGLNKLETFMTQTGLSRQEVENLFSQNLSAQE
ncbi:MAG: hypothetical protein F6K65_19220, partial [Moorea sp. SIO3C2]|nr:hypothetical protein [Moorena sp. SIO3C2]